MCVRFQSSSPVLTGLLLDEPQGQVIEQHEAQTHSQQHQVAGVQRVLVHVHGSHHLEERGRRKTWNPLLLLRSAAKALLILILILTPLQTHMHAVHPDGDVADGHGVLVALKLHLQHPLEAPAHEGGVRDPRSHWGITDTHVPELVFKNQAPINKFSRLRTQ